MKDALISQQEGIEPIQQVPSDSEVEREDNNSSSESLSDSDDNEENVFKLLRNKKTRLKTLFNPLVLLCATMFVPIIIISMVIMAWKADQEYGKGAAWDMNSNGIFMVSAIILLIVDSFYITAGINYHAPHCCCRKYFGWEIIIDGEDKNNIEPVDDISREENDKEVSVSNEEEGVGYGDDRGDSSEDTDGNVEIDINMKDNRLYM